MQINPTITQTKKHIDFIFKAKNVPKGRKLPISCIACICPCLKLIFKNDTQKDEINMHKCLRKLLATLHVMNNEPLAIMS